MENCTLKVILIVVCLLITVTGLYLSFVREKTNISKGTVDIQDGGGNFKEGSFTFKFAIGLTLIVVGLCGAIYSIKSIPWCDAAQSTGPQLSIVDNDTLRWDLDNDENYVLSYLLTDPGATGRGVWVYPANQQLSYRGYNQSKITAIITSLITKGLIESSEVLSYDIATRQNTPAPVYKITKKGMLFIQKNKQHLLDIKDTYSYTLRLYGTEAENQKFLENLQSLGYLQKQTRFVTEYNKKLCAIAIFAYKPVEEETLDQIAKIYNAKIYDFTKSE